MKQARSVDRKEKKCRRHWEEEGWRVLYIQDPHTYNIDRPQSRRQTKPNQTHDTHNNTDKPIVAQNQTIPNQTHEKKSTIYSSTVPPPRELLSDNQFTTIQLHHNSLSLHRDISWSVNKRIDVEGEHLGSSDGENATVGVVVLLW